MDNLKKTFKSKILNFYDNYEKEAELSFFLGGFVFDIFTLADVNDYFGIIQQVIYLSICAYILRYEITNNQEHKSRFEIVNTFWDYRMLILHFILGSLLSIYSLYFLLSSSFFGSLIFVIVMFTLMVLNELKIIQDGLFNIKVALFTLCLVCFFALLIPVFLGHIGLFPFIISIIITTLVIFFLYKNFKKKSAGIVPINKSFLFPSLATLSFFIMLYFLKLIPPVPISLKYIGVYHHVEKIKDQYILTHQRPWWKFWHNGDQLFYTSENDFIYVFAKISSPTGFSDKVILHWFQEDIRGNWLSTDKITMNIKGGRSGGFRGYAFKKNFSAGKWKVSVETTDEREIGRIYFSVQNSEIKNDGDFFTERI